MMEQKPLGKAQAAALIVLIAVITAGVVWLIGSMMSFYVPKPIAEEPVQPVVSVQSVEEAEPAPVQEEPSVPQPVVYEKAAVTEQTKTLDLQLYSEGALLIDLETNTVLAQKNPDARIYPASMTKIMTALVACERIENWDETFTMTQEIIDPLYLADATLAGFVDGEEVTMTDLVYGAILPSGAEATEALARHIAGSEAAYAELMNEKAAELGLADTHFVDASGLHHEEQYTTLHDMAIILRAAMDNARCREILSASSHTTAPTEQHPEGVQMVNKFLHNAQTQDIALVTIEGAKTGYTAQAMNCCASFGQTDGRALLCVTAHAWTGQFCLNDQLTLYSQYG